MSMINLCLRMPFVVLHMSIANGEHLVFDLGDGVKACDGTLPGERAYFHLVDCQPCVWRGMAKQKAPVGAFGYCGLVIQALIRASIWSLT